MAKSKRVAYLVQVIRQDQNGADRPGRTFYAVLTEEADAALQQVEALCRAGERAILADGFLSTSSARALGLRPDEPRRL